MRMKNSCSNADAGPKPRLGICRDMRANNGLLPVERFFRVTWVRWEWIGSSGYRERCAVVGVMRPF